MDKYYTVIKVNPNRVEILKWEKPYLGIVQGPKGQYFYNGHIVTATYQTVLDSHGAVRCNCPYARNRGECKHQKLINLFLSGKRMGLYKKGFIGLC